MGFDRATSGEEVGPLSSLPRLARESLVNLGARTFERLNAVKATTALLARSRRQMP